MRDVDTVGRMQEQRYVQTLGPLPDDAKRGVVEIVPERVRVHQRTTEAELRHRALQLDGRLRRILEGESSEPGEPVRVRGDCAGQQVVDRPGGGHRHAGVGLRLDTGRVQREHLQVETRRVHGLQPLTGQVKQAAGRVLPHGGLGDPLGRRAVVRELRSDEVFLDTDRAHPGLLV